MGWLLFFPFPSFRLTKPWLSGLTGFGLSVGNPIKSFLYLDASPVMTSCGQVPQAWPGCVRRGRVAAVELCACEDVSVDLLGGLRVGSCTRTGVPVSQIEHREVLQQVVWVALILPWSLAGTSPEGSF